MSETTTAAAVVAACEAHVRAALHGDGTGHDWWHVDRVRRTALRLARAEGGDPFVVELAALLHDVADHKFHGGSLEAGPAAARAFLEGAGVDAAVTAHVVRIVAGVSFKGAGVPTPMDTVEGRVVQDADRLDALGAIGVARAFAYGGARGRPLHDPAFVPEAHGSFEAYRGAGGPTTAHFHEKLLLLRDRLHTDAARRIAAGRHAFLETFLARFHAEWDGTDGEAEGAWS